jgi:hypothetical protein
MAIDTSPYRHFMAHKRKDTLVRPPEWWKHLKHLKRVQNGRERIAAKKDIEKRRDESPDSLISEASA